MEWTDIPQDAVLDFFKADNFPLFQNLSPQLTLGLQVDPFVAQPLDSSTSADLMPSHVGSAESSPTQPPGAEADGGYTCTYSGCTQRLETPALLKEHKRESHRRTGNGVIDNQAGPHRCDRFNPHTGQPCNMVFRGAYEFTRHEATVHNPDKKQLRCNLCTSTFSRADARIRHYRISHADVEIPDEHRRRGGQKHQDR